MHSIDRKKNDPPFDTDNDIGGKPASTLYTSFSWLGDGNHAEGNCEQDRESLIREYHGIEDKDTYREWQQTTLLQQFRLRGDSLWDWTAE